MKKKKVIAILLVVVILIGGGWIIKINTGAEIGIDGGLEGCVVAREQMVVRGSSLDPLIKGGETIMAFFGYYDCNEIKRNDVVLFKYAGSETPLIKIVKAVPEDSFSLVEKNSEMWNILINGKVLENSEGEEYLINRRKYEMLALYERSYDGVIPDDAYLLLSDITSGGTDSTRFGLVSKGGILGKAKY